MDKKLNHRISRFSLLSFNRLLISVLFVFVLIIGFNFYNIFQRSKTLSRDIAQYKETALKKQKILSDLQIINSRIKSTLFLHLLSDQDAIMDAYLDGYRKLASQNDNTFIELSANFKTNEEVVLLKNLNRFRSRLTTQREYCLNLSRRHLKDEAENYYSRSLYYAYSLYTLQLQNLTDYTSNDSAEYYDVIQKKNNLNYSSMRWIGFWGVLFTLLLVIFVWRIIVKLNKDNLSLNDLLLIKEKAESEIKKLNEDLESKVIERTRELENAHVELVQQIAAVNSAAIVSETDQHGTITFINDMFCEVSGYSREELLGQNHRLLKSGKQPAALFVGMWAALTKGLVWKGLIQNKNKNGKYYWVESTIMPFKNSTGEIVKFVAIRFDVTKQIEQQNILLEQADELAAQSEELRVQQEELHETNSVLSAQAKKLMASEEELKMQHEELMQSNSELEEKSQLIEERNLLIHNKNSELQTIANELEKKATELTLSSKYKSEFLANMSHELRTPLNSILLLSKLLADNNDGNLSADQIEYAGVINSSGNGLLELINEILDLSKIEAGKMDVNKENIPISYLCKSVDNIFKPLAKNRGIEFNIVLTKDIPTEILTDRIRVEQVLKNLISNAIKFTEKGKVEMKIYVPTIDLVSALNLPDNDYVAFEVNDSGIGIPENKLEHVFEAFQQADGSTQRKYGGTGLGLAISREIAHLLCGEITLKSELGKGSTFTFVIPTIEVKKIITNTSVQPITEIKTVNDKVSENNILKTYTPTSKEVNKNENKTLLTKPKDAYLRDKALSGKKLLIVDDDSRNIFSLQALLKNQNVTITTAENGKEALAALYGDSKFDLVIMDMMMPEMDGYETVKELRKNSNWKDLPVIALTAKVMQGDREKCMEAGVSDYLKKPVVGEQLLSLLRVWLYK